MALTDNQITAQNFKSFYNQIRPYLQGSAHSGFTPVGTVISIMGKQAPLNYLVCDGTVYNISDYPELATYFAGQFETSNFFGGDGETTFAVPDLRGEFLRGSGINSRADQGSGAEVGVHQDATEHLFLRNNGNNGIVSGASTTAFESENEDTRIGSRKASVSTGAATSSDFAQRYTSRPTNTSVLYCIATKNIFMDAGNNYSTEEQVVGTWIDGKPIYQKTITISNCQANTWNNTNHNISNIDVIVNEYGLAKCTNGTFYNIGYRNAEICGMLQANSTTAGVYLGSHTVYNNSVIFITLQYTKTTD